jgi:lipid-binding SYLF domain-containing protein
METKESSVSEVLDNEYKYGFVTDVESETFAKGLNEGVVRAVSKKKGEPEFIKTFSKSFGFNIGNESILVLIIQDF